MRLTRTDRIAWWLYEQASAKAKEAYYRRLGWLEQGRPCGNCGGHNADSQRYRWCAECRGAA